MPVTLSQLPPLADLAYQWQELEARANPSLFTSWHWIGCWLESLPPRARPRLLTVKTGGRIVGLATIGSAQIQHAGIMRSRALHLNATGIPNLDEITIEHNGFLTEPGAEADVFRGCAELLLGHDDWDEWVLPGLTSDAVASSSALSDVHPVVATRRPCYYVDLDVVRASGRRYCDILGRNTRHKIRRSVAALEKVGTLDLVSASTLSQAQSFYDELRQLHQAYWNSKGLPGSFASPFFCEFHRRFIENGFPKGIVQLLRMGVGDRTLGYLYNFVHRGRVIYYQSGFDYSLGADHYKFNSPGLVAHAHAVDFNCGLGHRVYDFLAGQAQYKQQLGTHAIDMYWMSLRRDRLQFRVANWLQARRPALARIQRWMLGADIGEATAPHGGQEHETKAPR